MPYRATKRYGHELGLSACFRQHKANSHCSKLHGYALAFTIVFEAEELDERNWVLDFGGMGPIKEWLKDEFDHKTIVAADDPEIKEYRRLDLIDVLDLVIRHDVGCEAFAEWVGVYVTEWLHSLGHAPRVRLVSVECHEHGGNSATWVAGDE